MFIIIIFITITQQPEQDRWAENQPTAGLSSLNEYEYENGMRRSKTELKRSIPIKILAKNNSEIKTEHCSNLGLRPQTIGKSALLSEIDFKN